MVLIDYYKTLNIAHNAPGDDIKKAYRQLAKKFHPDAAGADEFYAARFKDIQEAYDVLSNPVTRKLYNAAHRRFSKHAYAIGNNLVANDSRDNAAQYAWHPAHRKTKQLLSQKQSLLIGLSIVFICVVGASVFFGVNRNTAALVDTDTGYMPPVAATSIPVVSGVQPAPQPVIAEKNIVVSDFKDAAAPVIGKPPRIVIADKDNGALPSIKTPAIADRKVPHPLKNMYPVAVLPAIPLSAMPSPVVSESIASLQNIAQRKAIRYGYVIFTIRRNIQRTGVGNDNHLFIYVSGVSSYNSLSQEDVARYMLDAEIKCSAIQSKFVAGIAAPTQIATYRIESRQLKSYTTAKAAMEAMRREPKSNQPEGNAGAMQYGYLIFKVRREIRHSGNTIADIQFVTYVTRVLPYDNLSAEQRVKIIVAEDAKCSQNESRYATTHSGKNDAITYSILGRNFKTFKTEAQADDSRRSEQKSISLE